MTVKAYGARASDQPLESLDITRRAPGAHDVQIAIAYCGVCHSDIHQVRAEWAGTLFPCTGARDCWPRIRRRCPCQGRQSGRLGRGGLHGRQLPTLRGV